MCSIRATFLKISGTKDNGWLLLIVCNCVAVGVVFLVFCEITYLFGVIDNFVLYSFI